MFKAFPPEIIREDARKDLPPADSPNFSHRVREVLSTYLGARGDKLDRGVTLRDLADANIVTINEQYLGGANAPPIQGPATPAYVADMTPPPTPTGVAVTAAISHLLIQTDNPTFTQGHGYARTNVFGVKVSGPTDTTKVFADAVLLTQFSGQTGTYPSDPAQGWRIWLTWETVDGIESNSPSGGGTGDFVQTGQDVRKLLDAITAAAETTGAPFSRLALRGDLIYVTDGQGNNSAGLFSIVTTPVTVNGVTVPAGVYLSDLFVMNGTITNAKIANAAIDDAKVANLSASKLTAGSIDVGAYIQSLNYVGGVSGWRIHGNGTAEFAAASIRGQLTSAQIAAGAIGAEQIAANAVTADKLAAVSIQVGKYIQSASYSYGTSGWRIDGNGQAEFNNVTVRGDVYANNGYFSGTLAANIVTQTSIADGAVANSKLGLTSVSTDKIQNNAVSEIFLLGPSGAYSPAKQTWTTIFSGSVNSNGIPSCAVTVSGYAKFTEATGLNSIVRVTVGSNVLYFSFSPTAYGFSVSINGTYNTPVAAGSVPYSVEVYLGDNGTFSSITVLFMGLKR